MVYQLSVYHFLSDFVADIQEAYWPPLPDVRRVATLWQRYDSPSLPGAWDITGADSLVDEGPRYTGIGSETVLYHS